MPEKSIDNREGRAWSVRLIIVNIVTVFDKTERWKEKANRVTTTDENGVKQNWGKQHVRSNFLQCLMLYLY